MASADRLDRDRQVVDRYITPLTINPRAPLPRRFAWTLILGAYAVFWGPGIVDAIRYLMGALPLSEHTVGRTLSQLSADVGALALGVALLTGLAWYCRVPAAAVGLGRSPDNNARQAWGALVAATAASLLMPALTIVTAWIPGLAGEVAYPFQPPVSLGASLLDAFETGLGGAVEELLVLAVPVVTLRAAGYSWPVVAIAAAVLRAAFHVYYGPAVIPGAIAWALVVVGIYAWTARIWPIFAAHALHNIMAGLSNTIEHYAPGAAEAYALMQIAVTVGLVEWGVIVGVGVFRARDRLERHRRDTARSPRPPV